MNQMCWTCAPSPRACMHTFLLLCSIAHSNEVSGHVVVVVFFSVLHHLCAGRVVLLFSACKRPNELCVWFHGNFSLCCVYNSPAQRIPVYHKRLWILVHSDFWFLSDFHTIAVLDCDSMLTIEIVTVRKSVWNLAVIPFAFCASFLCRFYWLCS